MLTAEQTTHMCDVLDRAAEMARTVDTPAQPADQGRLLGAALRASSDLMALAERIHTEHQEFRDASSARHRTVPTFGRVLTPRGGFDPAGGGGEDQPDDPPDDEARP